MVCWPFGFSVLPEPRATRPGAPFGQLVFDVELVDFAEPVKVETPADVAAPPADAPA